MHDKVFEERESSVIIVRVLFITPSQIHPMQQYSISPFSFLLYHIHIYPFVCAALYPFHTLLYVRRRMVHALVMIAWRMKTLHVRMQQLGLKGGQRLNIYTIFIVRIVWTIVASSLFCLNVTGCCCHTTLKKDLGVKGWLVRITKKWKNGQIKVKKMLAGNNARGCSCKVSPTYIWGILVDVVAAVIMAVVRKKVI